MTISRGHHRKNPPRLASRAAKKQVERNSPARVARGSGITVREDPAAIERRLFGELLSNIAQRMLSDPRLGRLWQLLEERYADPRLSLQTAAKTSGMCANGLNTLLRERTSLTFHRLLIRYRLLRAINTITSGNGTTLEVALDVGFGTARALERNSRRILGVPPSHFRKAG
jgi:AraC-like DNA-binding protein